MPRFGGLSPYPNKFGGPGPNGVRLKVILDALNRERGDAYDASRTYVAGTGWMPNNNSNVDAENMATARVVNDIWSTNQRMANQSDPARMTTNIARWEKFLGITPGPADNDATRRARISTITARTGQSAFTGYLITQLSSLLGAFYVALEFISYANANIHVPDGTYPWGTVAAGAPWYSTTAHILIRTQKPTGYSEADYRNAIAKVNPFLDAVAPVWMTWTVYRPGPVNYAVTGGPSAGGFYLDDLQNLDFEVLGT